MRRALIMAGLALPVALAACARQPAEPARMLAAGEQACVDAAVAATGAEPAAVAVTMVSIAKMGATLYAVSAGGVAYTCVVEPDLTVSRFTAA